MTVTTSRAAVGAAFGAGALTTLALGGLAVLIARAAWRSAQMEWMP